MEETVAKPDIDSKEREKNNPDGCITSEEHEDNLRG